MARSKFILGLGAAIVVIFIWSGFLVFSRLGVSTGMTAYDIAALRFAVAGGLVLPFARSWWPSHLPLKATIIMAASGPGAIYSIMMYLGLTEASAAYGGVFANGTLPIFTMILAALLARQAPGKSQIIASVIIVAGCLLLGFRGMTAGGPHVITGIALFLSASAILSVYIIGIRHWAVTPRQALVIINLPNALIFLPLWFFFLPSGLADAALADMVLQAAFQGLGPGFLAVICFALAAMHLGPTATSGFSASVPAAAALLAIPVLSEIPTTMEWLGIVTVTIGLVLLILRR